MRLASLRQQRAPRTNRIRRNAWRRRRHSVLEYLERRLVLAASGIPTNPFIPELTKPDEFDQVATVGETLTLDLPALGWVAVDFEDAEGTIPLNEFTWQVDPDFGTDTPIGVTMTFDGVFSWTPAADQMGMYEIIVIVTDKGNPALAAVERFTVNVNAPPELDLNADDPETTGFSATYTEGDPPVEIVGNVSITDPGGDGMLHGAMVTITNASAGDMLDIDLGETSITIGAGSTDTMLILEGVASIEDYEAVLSTLTFENTSQNPVDGDRTIEIKVNDGMADSNTAVSTVTVIAVNDAPVLDLDNQEGEDPADPDETGFEAEFVEGAGAVSIVGNVSIADPDSDTLVGATVTIVNAQAGDVLDIDLGETGITIGAGSTDTMLILEGEASIEDYISVLATLTFNNSISTPAPSDVTREIEIQVDDGGAENNLSNVAVSTVTMVVNNAPDMDPLEDQSGPVGEEIRIELSATDDDGDDVTFQLGAGAPEGAEIVEEEGSFFFVWTPTEAGEFTIDIIASDDPSGRNPNLPSKSDLESFVVNVSESSEIGAVDDEFLVQQNDELTELDVLGNDNDGGGTITVIAVGTPDQGGTVEIGTDGLNVVYTPAEDFFGTETFTYTISDGEGGESTATVTVTVNAPPEAVDDSDDIVEQNSTGNELDVLANDTDPDGDDLTIIAVGTPDQGGTVEIAEGGTHLIYTPAEDFFGTEEFTYTISDGKGGESTATVTVTVNAPPVVDLNGEDEEGTSFATIFTEGGDAEPIVDTDEENGLVVTDADNTTLQSATITLNGIQDAGQEVLGINEALAPGGVTVDTSVAGVITISGEASLAEYQALLRTLTYQNTAASPTVGERTIEVVVNDGISTGTATATVTVELLNTPPVVDLNGDDEDGNDFAADFTIGGGEVPIVDTEDTANNGLLVIDPDEGAMIVSATIMIEDREDGDSEILAVNDTLATMLGIDVDFTDGVLTLTGAALPEEYQQLLRTLTYDNTAAQPTGTSRTVSFVVNDGIDDSNTALSEITFVEPEGDEGDGDAEMMMLAEDGEGDADGDGSNPAGLVFDDDSDGDGEQTALDEFLDDLDDDLVSGGEQDADEDTVDEVFAQL